MALGPHPLGMEGVLHSLSNFGLFLSGVSLDIILEPDAKILTVVLGETATFRCSLTGGHSDSYRASWYKKSERNNSLTLVYIIKNNSSTNARSHFKGDIDSLNSQYIFVIQNTTTEDAGTYYCGSDIHSAAVLLLVASETPRSN